MQRPRILVLLSVLLLTALVLVKAYIVHRHSLRSEDASEMETESPVATGEHAGQTPVPPKIKARAGDTPLHLAVRRGEKDLVERLLDAGADVHARNKDGAAPLHVAIGKRDRQIVRMLLDAGADVNAKRVRYILPPLHSAASAGDPEILKMLLDRGADLTQGTPLLTAATRGRREACKVLIERGADIHASEYDRGFTALHWAAKHGWADVAELLIARGAKVDGVAQRGGTPLQVAAFGGRNAVIRTLLAHGADVESNGHDLWGLGKMTPLLLAACCGWSDTLDLLLAHGAKINAVTDDFTPLSRAVSYGPGAVELLISRGAEVNPKTPGVFRPIHAAGTHAETIDLLLSKGAEIDIFAACQLGRLDDVKRLLKSDPSVVHSRILKDITPLRWARRHRREETARMLVASGAEVDIESAAWLGMVDRVKEIIERDGLAMDSHPAERAVDEAAFSGQKAVIAFLLLRGFDLRKAPWSLVRAAEGRRIEIAELLLSKGVAVNDVETTISAPLHEAAKLGDMEMAKLLLAHGANVNIIEQHEGEETPLDYAMGAGHKEMAMFLLASGAEKPREAHFHPDFLEQAKAKGPPRRTWTTRCCVPPWQTEPRT